MHEHTYWYNPRTGERSTLPPFETAGSSPTPSGKSAPEEGVCATTVKPHASATHNTLPRGDIRRLFPNGYTPVELEEATEKAVAAATAGEEMEFNPEPLPDPKVPAKKTALQLTFDLTNKRWLVERDLKPKCKEYGITLPPGTRTNWRKPHEVALEV